MVTIRDGVAARSVARGAIGFGSGCGLAKSGSAGSVFVCFGRFRVEERCGLVVTPRRARLALSPSEVTACVSDG